MPGEINATINLKHCIGHFIFGFPTYSSGFGKTWLAIILLNWKDKKIATLLTALGFDKVNMSKISKFKVNMSWISDRKKNYLHMAAYQVKSCEGLPETLKILLDRAR